MLSTSEGYGKTTSLDENAPGVRVSHFTWDEIEKMTGLTINTIIFDCEGCMFPILSEYKHKFQQIDKLVIENDKTAGWDCGEECEAANMWLVEQGMTMSHSFIGTSMHKHFVFRREGL